MLKLFGIIEIFFIDVVNIIFLFLLCFEEQNLKKEKSITKVECMIKCIHGILPNVYTKTCFFNHVVTYIRKFCKLPFVLTYCFKLLVIVILLYKTNILKPFPYSVGGVLIDRHLAECLFFSVWLCFVCLYCCSQFKLECG